jgi:hypothetical protein
MEKELTDIGVMKSKGDSSRTLTPLQGEWQVVLQKKSTERPIKIAISTISLTAPTQAGVKFDAEENVLKGALIDNFNKTGNISAFLTTKQLVNYDPGKAKGGSPFFPDADIADFVVQAYGILTPASAPIGAQK